MKTIRKAAVIGSGVMGSGIAAHLANVGISCLLLDIVPAEQGKEDSANDPKERSRLAAGAIERVKKAHPSPLYDLSFAQRITPGNIEDHFEQLRQVDWIIEAITENLQLKKELYARIEQVWTPGTIVSSNTSGISIREMAADCGVEFRKHFLGTHFFNPPRYMKLLEVIPGPDTLPDIVNGMVDFCGKRLGKGVVVAKDTPNFVANRIGTYGLLVTLQEMERGGYSVEEVDAATGPAIGHPKSATFRTLDLVGLDTFVHVARNVYDNIPAEAAEEKAVFAAPPLLERLAANGWIGEKAGQGFYKKIKTPGKGSDILALRPETMEYAPRSNISSASLTAAKAAKGAPAKLQAFLSTPDRYSELAWNILKRVLVYAADKLGEIADTVADIDLAMKWGFNWQLGPFETWDAIGVRQSVAKMESEGMNVPAWVKEWLAAGHETFYEERNDMRFYVHRNEYKGMETKPESISLAALKRQNKTIRSNPGASLIDLGDDVACLEFHSPNNAIGADILTMIQQSVEEVRQRYRGLVIANEGRHFCVGANLMLLLMEAQDGEWEEVDAIIRLFQNTMMDLKRLEKPVVAAPHSMTLGGGVEACMPADRIYYAAETYFGLVETGVGLIPAGGGCKEMALRASRLAAGTEADVQPYLNKTFETIALAKVSTSGFDTANLGYMRPHDRVIVNADHRIYEAKLAVLEMDRAGYAHPSEEKIRVAGEDGKAVMQLGALAMRQGGYISDHDLLIAGKLAHVLAGGNAPAGALVSEQYMLDLEREAFLSLTGEPKTQQRMQHMLMTGKPLRN
ncbi:MULTISPECIES: 3-hydroxyacyl-CoA dehydrogenase/enoyl-CoA hydratase family protein [unclassified Paenibacillus]|uniref:3-hydroxyacyl-CoA dehydrogenase/enoyl-CoA hydratase family protein n=1 Tax=unclassified Paenibacillus TaxID=185978 RepID=UPI001C115FE2|nr:MULTISPECIES: 3-hydroxyacyl-CoA dehydrogenase/enoyl-CoA hydratase family protein [unclassified Paenibacillus]MBU5440707.1 enoyl-CoA hydratase/isomerase family protein [Paenibacillus sp. MSJ-34]CAH0120439.1 putative 3-hydroxyacyl-CoA dehydrogenase [Paenibacillus sp. CECT 9249]